MKINFKKKAAVAGLLLMILLSFQNPLVSNSSDYDFTIDIVDENLDLKIGRSVTSTFYVNSTTNASENVSLSGSWVGTEPDNVTVELSQSYGLLPITATVTFTSNETGTGDFIYKITAEGKNSTSTANIGLNIISNSTISVLTNKTSFSKGEQVNISGNLTSNPPTSKTFSELVTITLTYGSWKREFNAPLVNNSYNCSYNISYGDPEGEWNITAQIQDEDANNFAGYKKINVTIPTGTVRYKVVWYSPSDSAIYQKGSRFNVSIFVTEDGTGVKNLTTNCVLPTLENITLSELQQGYYIGSYKIPWDSDTGIWVLSFEGIDSSSNAGGSNVSINVQPATVNVELIEPSLDEYYLGDEIELKTLIKYSDNTTLENALVTSEILGEDYTMSETSNGTYLANYKISDANAGSIIIDISVEDEFGNTGSLTKIIYVVEKQDSSLPIVTIISVTAGILVLVFIAYFLKKKIHLLRVADVEDEIEEVKRLQDETAQKYYKEGSISRQAYDSLRKEHSERLAELKGDSGKHKLSESKFISKLRWNKDE